MCGDSNTPGCLGEGGLWAIFVVGARPDNRYCRRCWRVGHFEFAYFSIPACDSIKMW